MKDFLTHHLQLDRRLVEIAQSIKLLTALAWPQSVHEEFSHGLKLGNPQLPIVEYPDFGAQRYIEPLRDIMDACDRGDPVGQYVYRTAESYHIAAQMLANIGRPLFTELSVRLYGQPNDRIAPGSVTHLDAANFFADITRDFTEVASVPETNFSLNSEQVAEALREELVPFFHRHEVKVVIDPNMASRAAAGAQRIRLRAATKFSARDIAQLVHHEGYVHMLTALNGREQPHLGSLALGSPRTTWTQEGLATFSELVSASIDLHRMRRIALRTHAVQMGLDGADFLEIFRYFLDAGQDEYESFQSTARIFRGGDTRGGVVFTKDVVYLQGLLRTHTFLRKAVQSNKFHYAEHLFAGRMTLGDIVALEPLFASGVIVPPAYEPPWLQQRSCLAAYLCYSVFANRINLASVTLDDFHDLEDSAVGR